MLPRPVDRIDRQQSTWDHSDWGTHNIITAAATSAGLLTLDEARKLQLGTAPSKHKKPAHASLDQFRATAIAGNDLLSSCLYTAGLCAQFAGPLAPVALLLVAVMLGFFRHVYAEVVTALPINGGTYNALLNTTNKRIAAVAACLSLLSYIATAVVSAFSAVQYIQPIWSLLNGSAAAALATIVLLGAFAVLTLFGIGESSVVAVAMFFLHCFTLIVLIIMSFVRAFQNNWGIFVDNLSAGFPEIAPNNSGSWGYALFLGYAAALLGITGFETAANYVEDMKSAKVYMSTVRNMWLSSALFNPLISLCAMAVMPMSVLRL
jgi:amino acid transporter